MTDTTETAAPAVEGASTPAESTSTEVLAPEIDMSAALDDIESSLAKDLGLEPELKDKDDNADPGDEAAKKAEAAAVEAAKKVPAADPAVAVPAAAKPPIPSALPNGLPQEFRTWRPETQALLLKLQSNPELKPVFDEALKREQDMDKGISQYKEAAGFAEVFRKTLQPFMPLAQHHGLDPIKEVGQLLQFRATLALGTPEQKLGIIRSIAKSAGVSFEQLGMEEPAVSPEVAQLRAELGEIKSHQLQEQERYTAERTAQLRTELEAFAADPANLYFNEVAGEIPRLINSKLAKGYKDAYDMAVRLSPVVQAKESQRIAEEAVKAASKKAADEAEASKKARAANVKSSAKNRSAAAPVGSIEDTLKETYREIQSRNS